MKTKNLLLVALLMSAAVVNAKVWRVNPNITYDADFHTLQEAVDTAWVTDGDTLLCEAGYYDTEYGTYIKKALTFIGTGGGHDNSGIAVSETTFGEIQIDHDSVTIEGVVLTSSNGIYVYGNHLTLKRCVINSTFYGRGSFMTMVSCISNWTSVGNNATCIGNIIGSELHAGTNSYIVNNTINFSVSTTNSVIKDNIIFHNGGNSFNASGNNTVTNNILGQATPTSGYENNIYGATKLGLLGVKNPDWSIPQQFRITETDEFNAKTSSSTGGECGAFGGAEPFRIGMRPFGIPYIYDVAIPSTVVGDQLNINFKVGLQNE